MKSTLIDSSEFHTEVGIFKRETRISDVSDCGHKFENRLFLNGIEYANAVEIRDAIGIEAYKKLKSEVEKLSTVLDIYMFAFLQML